MVTVESGFPRWLKGFERIHHWRRWFVFVFIMGMLWIIVSRKPVDANTIQTIPNPHTGFIAPDFTLDALSGGSLSLTSLRGKVILVNFWASWCGPCQSEMPALEAVYRKYKHLGFEILAVNTTYQDNEAVAAAFYAKRELSFPMLLDRDGAVSRSYQLRAMPTSFFITSDGIIRETVFGGPMTEASIAAKLADLLGK